MQIALPFMPAFPIAPFLIISFLLPQALLSQTFKVTTTESFSHQWLQLNDDSLLIFHRSLNRQYENPHSSYFTNEQEEWSWLLLVKEDGVDTLLSEYAPHYTEDEGMPDNRTHSMMVQALLGFEMEYNDFHSHYEGRVRIRHVGMNIFEIEHGRSTDQGGAHPSGHTHYSYWDLNTRQLVQLSDIMEPEGGWALRLLSRQALLNEFPSWTFPEESETRTDWGDPEPMNEIDIILTPEGLTVQCQMYESLFDFGSIGYQHLSFDFSWGQLKPWLKKNSPVAALVDAAAKD